MKSRLEKCVFEFTDWRNNIVAAIEEFRSWQEMYGHADIEQTLRLYDLVEGLRNDQMHLAFVGESAEDKIGLINALLFSDLPGGLLPLGPGSEFMCPTEIFYNPAESPFVRLLPIDTRKSPESIATLRRSSVEWITMRLNADSPESITEIMRSLTESRAVSIDEAKSLNLPGMERTGDVVSIPAWRYALINLPHPMLKIGLAAFYSPGLYMLSAEPELAMRISSSAQSLMMMLGNKITVEAQEVWTQYVLNSRADKFVVLDTGTGADEATRKSVANTLELASGNVFLLAVKQSIANRLAQGQPETDASDGIEQLERAHIEQVVPKRQTHLLSSIVKEIGVLVQSARQAVAARFIATIKEMQDLTSTSGKNNSAAQEMLAKLEEERKTYQKSVSAFEMTYAALMAKGQELLSALHDDRIEHILAHDKEFIEGAWTSAGMWKSMQGLFTYFSEHVEKILNYGLQLQGVVNQTYKYFHEHFGLARVTSPTLTLERHLDAMRALEESARHFCHHPVNVATYKSILVKKFYDGLVEEARQRFEWTRVDTEHWLRAALGPLHAQIRERQTFMLKRVENLRNLKNNQSSLQERLKNLDQQRLSLKEQGDKLDSLRSTLSIGSAAGAAAKARSAAVTR